MSQKTTLLRKALKDAKLTSESAQGFWESSLGKAKTVRQEYIKYRTRTAVNRRVIFYETMSGARMGDNPFSIFEYLRSHPQYGNFLHVWSVDANSAIPAKYKRMYNVVFARRNTASYTYFLACAGHVIGNANLPGFFTRRPQQKYLNTWHGIPYKALGRNTPKARFGNPAGTATFLKATHVLTPCQFMTDTVVSAYSMSGVSNATIAETGYPRVDLTLNPARRDLTRLRKIFGTDDPQVLGDSRPRVLYAPTWRSENDEDVVDTDQLIEDLKALAALDVQIMYRGHHRMDRLIRDSSVSDLANNVVIPPHEVSSNDLMTVVDILITDYSSIYFDFLPTGRPIVQYLYDYEEYKRARGLNLELEELPGAVAFSREELVASVQEIAQELAQADENQDFSSAPLQGAKYNRAQLRFCPLEDGESSKRAANFFMKDDTVGVPSRKVRDERPTVAFWAGNLPEGPDAEYFLKQVIESGKSLNEQTILIIDRTASLNKTLLMEIKQLGNSISTVSFRPEGLTLLPTETAEYEGFVTDEIVDQEIAKSVLRKSTLLRELFAHEYRRRLDDAQFDHVILGTGLTNHELALASFADAKSNLPQGKRILSTVPKPSMKQKAEKLSFPKNSTRRRLAGKAIRTLKSL